MLVKHAVFPPIENNCYLIVDENTKESALVDCSTYNETMQKLIGDTSLMVLTLDNPVSTAVIEKVKSSEAIFDAILVAFDE